MKKKDVQVGNTYAAKIGSQVVPVRLDAESRFGGWDATNLRTKRRVRIKSAAKLRHPWRTSTAADRPPQDIDERIAAAPPSIVPYEQRRARAEAASAQASSVSASSTDAGGRNESSATAADESVYDPDRCATQRCRGTPVMTHLGRPLCQTCWERHCVDDAAAEFIEEMDHELKPAAEVPDGADATVAAADLIETASAPVQTNKENIMATKTKTTKRTNAKGATTKATAAKSAAAKSAKARAAGTRKVEGPKREKRVSALDAAAQVLAKAGKPMHALELITAMAEQGLWKSPGGKTPHATLYAAMMREERDKGCESRFRKVDRGQFAFNGKGA
ncbi:MAG: winged helix-turn-helix domain-containing protein [Phycisphaerae bacterium]|nr:winged helix-turn-helix domain-containing protein [Phycisphaerae bacterium]